MQRARPTATSAAAAAIAHLALGAPPALAAPTTANDITAGGAAIHIEFEPGAFRDSGESKYFESHNSSAVEGGSLDPQREH